MLGFDLLSASSGPGCCSGPVTYIFDPVRGNGIQTVSKHLSETDFTRTGNNTIRDGRILVTNVTRRFFDSSKPSTADEHWALTVKAVNPNGYGGGDLTVEGEGMLIGCNSDYLNE